MTRDVVAVLDELVDAHGLTHIVVGLSLVCTEKAALLDDRQAARRWEADSKTLEDAARLIRSDA